MALDVWKLNVHFLQKSAPAPQDLDSKTSDAIAIVPYLIGQNEEVKVYKANKHFLSLAFSHRSSEW